MAATALVTGASSGIGEEFALALAERGHELVLVARRRDRLERLAGELPTQCHVIECDLGADAASVAPRVQELGLHVELLVNNAGFGTWGPFVEEDAARLTGQVEVNCEAVVRLTRDLAPGMVERGSGGVIVVASTAGMQPIPYQAVYAASKAFALSFAEALHVELRDSGVRVLAVNPGPVMTEFQRVAGYGEEHGSGFVPAEVPATQVVDEALRAYDAGRRSIVPGTRMRWLARSSRLSPRGLQLRATERIYRPG
jgi:uncharacterized protein